MFDMRPLVVEVFLVCNLHACMSVKMVSYCLCFPASSPIVELIYRRFDIVVTHNLTVFLHAVSPPPLSLTGASLKVCPQGFSCCTVEMEEKLSQQSHYDIKAPVSRLSSNLQSTFRQRHAHFDRKRALIHKHQLHFML